MRDPSPYAGKTVEIRADAAEIGGLTADVVDWYDRTGAAVPWRQALAAHDPRAESYSVRRGLGGLPDDDDVLLARVDGMACLVHVLELVGASTPAPEPAGPAVANPSAVGRPCPACGVPLAEGDPVAVLALGPGADPVARANCLAGQPYTAVVVELHWACRTGDTQYDSGA